MRYELYYWPGIQGRGEFVRLALEEAGAEYLDVVLLPESEGGGIAAMQRIMGNRGLAVPPFAPPFLRAGDLVIAQTALILAFIGDELGLAPRDAAGRLHALQLQMTFTDFIKEAHDTHHPIASSLYYEEQKPESLRRAENFRDLRLPKFLGYFERVLAANSSGFLVGQAISYADTSLFQMVEGLRYAFPRAMAKAEAKLPATVAHHDRIAARPRIATYLASPRRIAFNESGIFRRYPELDG